MKIIMRNFMNCGMADMLYPAACPQVIPRCSYMKEASANCRQVVFGTQAFRTLMRAVALASRNGKFYHENGGFLYGFFVREEDGLMICVTDVVDGGPRAHHTSVTYEFDHEYVNHNARLCLDRHHNASFVGMIHIHPDGMTVFSSTDISTMREKYIPQVRIGFASGLITFTPDLHITMYFVEKNREGKMLCSETPVLVSDGVLRRKLVYDRPCSLAEIWGGERSMPHINVPMDEEAAASLYYPSPACRAEKKGTADVKATEVPPKSESEEGERLVCETTPPQAVPVTEDAEPDQEGGESNVSD